MQCPVQVLCSLVLSVVSLSPFYKLETTILMRWSDLSKVTQLPSNKMRIHTLISSQTLNSLTIGIIKLPVKITPLSSHLLLGVPGRWPETCPAGGRSWALAEGTAVSHSPRNWPVCCGNQELNRTVDSPGGESAFESCIFFCRLLQMTSTKYSNLSTMLRLW